MNRNEQEYYKDIKRIAVALEKIANKKQVKGFRGPVLTKAANKVKHI
tara:strand:- start:123 stop:263 length:141 start_codon:yes stop_codon:yes gene_type:complete